MKRHLVIFARAPQFGRVKRRLAGAIGPVAAMRFYRLTLDRQIRNLSRDRRWTVWLFVTPAVLPPLLTKSQLAKTGLR